jgi:DNA-binding IclR family transcriptional regulator
VKFKGDIQTIYLPKNESLYRDKENYKNILSKLLSNGYVIQDNTGYQLTVKGIFWGNTISR